MSMQDDIDQAGGALNMIRALNLDVRTAFPYPAQWTNWRDEQRAWATTTVLFNQSYHMADIFISGPDTLKLLSDTSVNSYANFRPGIAKQYVAVTDDGKFIGDAILIAFAEDEVNLVGREWALDWTRYQAEKGGYDVTIASEPASAGEPGSKRLYRYELEGPAAGAILGELTGNAVEGIRFFNTRKVTIAGHEVWAFNHTMGGVPGQEYSGYEFFGPAADEDDVIGAILEAGKAHGLVRGGVLSYFSAGAESGWLAPTVVPPIFTGEALREYREWLPTHSFQSVSIGAATGSYHPDTIEEYYATPWDYGVGHVIRFDHEFIGRAALEELAKNPPRQKVWLLWNDEDTARVVVDSELDRPGAPRLLPFPADILKDQVLIGDRVVGVTGFHGYTVNVGRWISLASVDTADAVDGQEVEILWGDWDGGAGNDRVPTHTQTRIRARVSVKSPLA